MDDYASGALKSLRDKLERTNAKIHEKADSVLKASRQYMSDNFSTVKHGRICVPVRKEYKLKVAGSVIDKPSTGSTLFIEPAAVAGLAEEQRELRIEEENEVIRILYTLTVLLPDKEEIIRTNNRTVEKLDFIFAKAKLSMEYDGIRPHINTGRHIRLKNGRHPLMDKAVNVPLNFQIGNGIRGIIITGPNTGGKTVAIKTADEKGVLRVQMQGKKIWINHKRIRLQVEAKQLYPQDYDFSIIFDSVAKRKALRDMERKFVDAAIEYED